MSRTVPTSIWDADRCIAVDENGMEVHGDYILYVCGKYLKECGRLQNNTVVATIMSNMGLFKAMKRDISPVLKKHHELYVLEKNMGENENEKRSE